MKKFNSLLVGVDLSCGDRLVNNELTEPNQEAVENAIWLAKKNAAQLHFFCVLDISERAQRLIEENTHEGGTVVDEGQNRLQELVAQAAKQGVKATSKTVFGKSWVEIIRQVLREDHDLVIVGCRQLSSVKRFLLGSTGMKLLRKCPCPVWVTHDPPNKQMGSILVAHDMQVSGDVAMELGCNMAHQYGSELHILHALEGDHWDRGYASTEEDVDDRNAYDQHIKSQLIEFKYNRPAIIHLVEKTADEAILEYLQKYNIEMLVMGTVARLGVPGIITGNTAERLLPKLPCSVIAVKPIGFKSPITLP